MGTDQIPTASITLNRPGPRIPTVAYLAEDPKVKAVLDLFLKLSPHQLESLCQYADFLLSQE